MRHFVLCAFIAFVFAGCSSSDDPAVSDKSGKPESSNGAEAVKTAAASEKNAPAQPTKAGSVAGAPIDPPKKNADAAKPRRIASTILATDEILLALVEPERIVALSSFANDPAYSNIVPQAAAVEKRVVGNAEQVVALNPDLIFAASYSNPDFLALIKNAGLTVDTLKSFNTFEDILANIEHVGQRVGETEKTAVLMRQTRDRIAAVRKAVEGKKRPTVLSFSYGWVAGKNTIVGEMIQAAGGENYAAQKGIEGNKEVSIEELVRWNPDFLLLLGDHTAGAPVGLDYASAVLLQFPALKAMPPVAERRVVTMQPKDLSPVSQYIAAGIESMGRLIQPDAFENFPR